MIEGNIQIGIPEAKHRRAVVVAFVIPDPGEHVETCSAEYDEYMEKTGPHRQLMTSVIEVLAETGLGEPYECGFFADWQHRPQPGQPAYFIATCDDEMALKEQLVKTIAENDFGLFDIQVFTQAEASVLVDEHGSEYLQHH